MLSPYPQLVRAGFRRFASYRQAALAGLTTNSVFGLLRAAVLVAVLAERPVVAGYDVAAAITYVWLGQGLLNVVLLWGDSELARRIRTGDVVVDLGRPWDLQAAMLATDLGRAGFVVLVRLVPPVAFGALLFPFRWPERPATWALFAGSALLGVVVSFGIRFLSSPPRSASSRSGSGCAGRSPRRCCTPPSCSCSTSPPSGSTWPARSGCARSCPP